MRTIVQDVTFDAPPRVLYELYVDSRKHSASTGGAAKLGRKEGDPFTAWDGWIVGRTLRLIPALLVVQAWRSTEWPKSVPDSVLVLAFAKAGRGGRVTLVHTNVPDAEAETLDRGWHDHYWDPWKDYLAASGRPKVAKVTAKGARKRR